MRSDKSVRTDLACRPDFFLFSSFFFFFPCGLNAFFNKADRIECSPATEANAAKQTARRAADNQRWSLDSTNDTRCIRATLKRSLRSDSGFLSTKLSRSVICRRSVQLWDRKVYVYVSYVQTQLLHQVSLFSRGCGRYALFLRKSICYPY